MSTFIMKLDKKRSSGHTSLQFLHIFKDKEGTVYFFIYEVFYFIHRPFHHS